MSDLKIILEPQSGFDFHKSSEEVGIKSTEPEIASGILELN